MTATSTNHAKNILLIISILKIKAKQDWRDKRSPEMADIMSLVDCCECGLVSHYMKSNNLYVGEFSH